MPPRPPASVLVVIGIVGLALNLRPALAAIGPLLDPVSYTHLTLPTKA